MKSQDLENGIIAGPQLYLPNPDDGRTPEEYALKVTEKIIVPVINAAMIVIGAGVEIPQMPTVPEPIPVIP